MNTNFCVLVTVRLLHMHTLFTTADLVEKPMIGSSQRPPFTPDSSAEEIAFNKGNAALGDARHNSVVNADGQVLGESGQILARPTAMSKFLRQWHESCWVHLKPASILLFRTRNDFEVWVKAANGDFSNRKRNRTTQLVIDFDTLGILADRRSSGNKENVAHGIEPSKLSTFSRGSSVKLLSKLQKYALGDVSSSMYGKMALYVFLLCSSLLLRLKV